MKKRLVSLLLVLCLTLSLLPVLPVGAWRSDTDVPYAVVGGNIYFNKSTGTVTDCDESVTRADIPEQIDGVAVTTIGNSAFYLCSALTAVKIPNSVTMIDPEAFLGCDALTAVTIPNSVTTIGSSAFFSCDGLTSVTIGDGVTTIGDGAFQACTNLTSITIPSSVKSIGIEVFIFCDRLTAINVAEESSTYSSQDGVLFNKEKTTLVLFPCGRGGTYDIPNGVTTIGDYAFENCNALTSVTIPKSVTAIGDCALGICSSLTSIEVAAENSAYSSQNGALFNKEKTTLVQVPGGKSGTYDISGSVTAIGDYAFCGCSSLTEVTIPNSVTTIGNRAFQHCYALTAAAIPDSVTRIGDYAFAWCFLLTTATIADSVKTIGEGAFYVCEALKAVYFEGDAPSVGADAFHTYDQVPLPNLTLYYIEGKSGWTSPTWNGYPTATWDGTTIPTPDVPVPGGIVTYPVEGGYIYFDKETGTITDCDETVTSANIPAEIDGVAVTAIGDRAFSDNCFSLTDVMIPDSVTTIGDMAFYECWLLKSIEIPNSVVKIGFGAFYGCSKLKYITIPAGITTIESGTFINCSALTGIFFLGDAPEIEDRVFGEEQYNPETGSIYKDNPNITLYYIEGKSGWTSPTWNGYPTATWDGIHRIISGYCGGEGDGTNLIWTLDLDTDILTISGKGAMADYMLNNLPEWETFLRNIQSVVVERGVTSIGAQAFMSISAKAIVIPDTIIKIGDNAFLGSDLTNIEIPGSVESIGIGAFSLCESLENVYLSNGIKEIGPGCFLASGLTEINIPESVTNIGAGAFAACHNLIKIEVNSDNPLYTNDKRGVLFDKSKTTLIQAPGAISGTYSIPDGVTKINESAYEDCVSLENVFIPKSVESIEDGAFTVDYRPDRDNTSALKNIYFQGNAPKLGEHVFQSIVDVDEETLESIYENINGLTLYYIEGKSGWTSPTWNGYPTATWDGKTDEPTPDDPTPPISGSISGYCGGEGDGSNLTWQLDLGTGVLDISGQGAMENYTAFAFIEGPQAPWLPYAESIKTVLVNKNVTTIGDGAFSYCEALTKVSLPEGLNSIGEYAFAGTKLTYVELPNSLTQIGLGAFLTYEPLRLSIPENVKAITDATQGGYDVDEKNPYFSSDADGVLFNKEKTILISAPVTLQGQYRIPDGVATIGYNAVSACNDLESVIIPASVREIEESAFFSSARLQNVYFLGDAPQIGAHAFQRETNDGYENIYGLTLYYIEGKSGWTTPTWNGYPTATWDGKTDEPVTPDDPSTPTFTDVPANAWYTEAVNYAVEHQLMNGMEGNTFQPNTSMTRAMLVTVLWRYADSPKQGENTFTDVPAGKYYTEAVAWAAANGIVNGVGNGKFNPDGNITREQLVTILYRYCKQLGINTSKADNLTGFPDAGSVGNSAKDAMRWAVAEKLIGGKTLDASGTVYLQPKGSATRAEVATILMRFIENILK